MSQYAKMKKNKSMIFLGFLLLAFTSCSDSVKLEDLVQEYALDGMVDDSELALITERVKEDRNFRRKYKDQDEIIAKIKALGIAVQQDVIDTRSTPTEETNLPENDSTKYDIYLENSGSMFGYINGLTELEEALMGLWTEIAKRGEKLDINFINDKIYPIQKEFDEFFDYLQPYNVRKIGETRSSKIADILKKVIEEVVKKDQPAMVLSDFIFSLEKGGDIEDKLSVQKYGLKSIIINNDLVEKGIGILVIKLNSRFDGRYYDYQNKPTVLKDTERPYYIWVIGKINVLKSFPDRYNISALKGYANHTLLYSAENMEQPYYSILKRTNTLGRFTKKDRAKEQITEIKGLSLDKRKKRFQFSVAVDFSEIPVEENYLSNLSNYKIDPNPGGFYEVVSVEPTENVNIKDVDKKIINSESAVATHIITIATNKVKSGSHPMGLALLKQLPTWIAESSVDNDQDIAQMEGKTFGFKYLVEGVNDGFKPLDHSYEKYIYLKFLLER